MSDEESDLYEENIDEELYIQQVNKNTDNIATYLQFLNDESDIPELQNILEDYFGDEIQNPRHRIFLNPFYNILDMKQEILDHYDDDELEEKDKFFSFLLEFLPNIANEKKSADLIVEKNQVSILKNKIKYLTAFDEKINITLKKSDKTREKFLTHKITKDFIRDNVPNIDVSLSSHIVLQSMRDKIQQNVEGLEENLISHYTKIKELEDNIRWPKKTIPKEDTTSKKNILEKLKPQDLKTWVREFYDVRNFKLLFDKDACDNITVHQLTQIAQHNDISLAPRKKKEPLSKKDKKKMESQKTLKESWIWKDEEERKKNETQKKSLTKKEKCDLIFKKLSENLGEPYVIGNRVFRSRLPYIKTLSYVWQLKSHGTVDTNPTLFRGMQNITCPPGYRTWDGGNLCCEGDILEDEYNSRCYFTKPNPKRKKTENDIDAEKKLLKEATTKRDQGKIESRIKRLKLKLKDIPEKLEIQHTKDTGPKVCALVENTAWDMCSTYTRPIKNPFYNARVWTLNGKKYTDSDVKGKDGDFKDYLQAYSQILSVKLKDPKISQNVKKNIKSHGKDIQYYLRTGLIERFKIVPWHTVPKLQPGPSRKIPKIKKMTKKEYISQAPKKELIIKKKYDIPEDKNPGEIDVQYIIKHISKKRKKEIETSVKKNMKSRRQLGLTEKKYEMRIKTTIADELQNEAENIYEEFRPYRKKYVFSPSKDKTVSEIRKEYNIPPKLMKYVKNLKMFSTIGTKQKPGDRRGNVLDVKYVRNQIPQGTIERNKRKARIKKKMLENLENTYGQHDRELSLTDNRQALIKKKIQDINSKDLNIEVDKELDKEAQKIYNELLTILKDRPIIKASKPGLGSLSAQEKKKAITEKIFAKHPGIVGSAKKGRDVRTRHAERDRTIHRTKKIKKEIVGKRTRAKSVPPPKKYTDSEGMSYEEARKGWVLGAAEIGPAFTMGPLYYDKDGWQIEKRGKRWFRTGERVTRAPGGAPEPFKGKRSKKKVEDSPAVREDESGAGLSEMAKEAKWSKKKRKMMQKERSKPLRRG